MHSGGLDELSVSCDVWVIVPSAGASTFPRAGGGMCQEEPRWVWYTDIVCNERRVRRSLILLVISV
jgi:hypothetical protein